MKQKPTRLIMAAAIVAAFWLPEGRQAFAETAACNTNAFARGDDIRLAVVMAGTEISDDIDFERIDGPAEAYRPVIGQMVLYTVDSATDDDLLATCVSFLNDNFTQIIGRIDSDALTPSGNPPQDWVGIYWGKSGDQKITIASAPEGDKMSFLLTLTDAVRGHRELAFEATPADHRAALERPDAPGSVCYVLRMVGPYLLVELGPDCDNALFAGHQGLLIRRPEQAP